MRNSIALIYDSLIFHFLTFRHRASIAAFVTQKLAIPKNEI